MGASHREYLDAHNRWQRLLQARRAPRGLALYRAVLGPAEEDRGGRWGDVLARYPNVRHVEPDAPHQWRLDVACVETRYRLVFAHGLLQRVG
jgi:hypothetical protein